ncbi:PaaR repeat-containing protein [Pseudoflavitalea sp. X16]|uniref:PAAR domain-containing protein n=1 Tax=Paraflavitalea devenefica TaxID=2716334 RepID=UPI0014210891|nr:PAAR domain-containing protein [Paraflavitalea devenefica]NII27609.1 PaaR repeat-containing protein [Paraflavitalea devenefica]
MPAAGRITDVTSDGVVTGAGTPTVLIGSLPAAVAGDISTPSSGNVPGPFTMGSTTVLIGGKPAIRVGDVPGNGSGITVGLPTVQIG